MIKVIPYSKIEVKNRLEKKMFKALSPIEAMKQSVATVVLFSTLRKGKSKGIDNQWIVLNLCNNMYLDENAAGALKRVCDTLNKNEVDYMVIGGIAVGYYGYQRVSGFNPEIKADLDFWYKPTITNYLNIVKSLVDLNVDTEPLSTRVFNPKTSFLKIPHGSFHIDFLPQMVGIDSYSVCQSRAEKAAFDGVQFLVLSYPDLKQNKLFVNRAIDRRDIDELDKGSQRDSGLSR